MKAGRNLQEVLMELQRQNQAKKDYIAPAQSMKLEKDTERVRVEESGTKTDVTRLISARMATEFERGLYYGKNE